MWSFLNAIDQVLERDQNTGIEGPSHQVWLSQACWLSLLINKTRVSECYLRKKRQDQISI
jgi:hypothetical protein